MPEIGVTYQRLQGDKQEVTVIGKFPNDYIQIKDRNGAYFVSSENFDQHFRRADENRCERSRRSMDR